MLGFLEKFTEKLIERFIFGSVKLLVVGAAVTLAGPTHAAPKDLLPEFRVPPGGVLRESVDFWIQIYGRYTSGEGVIHDSKYINVVYKSYDFRNSKESRYSLIKREKNRIKKILLRLHDAGVGSDPTKIEKFSDPEERRIAELYRGIDDPSKFLSAAHYKRLRFQLGQKDRFLAGVKLSGEYLPFMEAIFIRAGMPFELTRLPFVESSFNTKAKSKVGASGIWQFMRTTGADFLEIGDAIDERNDPIRATEAAAKLLSENYKTLGNWPLAVTAYNHGRSSLLRARNRLGTSNLEEIILGNRFRGFGFASANFFACLIAALEVERNAEKYFGKFDRARSHRFFEVKLPAGITLNDLVSFLRLKRTALIELNPGFTDATAKSLVRIPKGYVLRVPNEKGSGTDRDLASKRRIFLAGFEKIPRSYRH